MRAFRRLFSADKSLLVIEIGDQRIKLVEAEMLNGRRQIRRIASCPVSPNDEEETITESIRRLLESFRIASGKVILNVPRHLTISKFLKLPSIDEKEIQKMAKMEVLRQLPYNEEDIVAGCKVIEKTEGGYSTVLLASILKLTVERFLRILKEVHLDVEKIALGSESLYLWFTLDPSRQKELVGKSVLLVNIDSDYLDMDVIEDGRLAFTRGVLLFNTESTSGSEKIIEDIIISAETYQNQSTKDLSEIYVCDPQGQVKELLEHLSQDLKIPIHLIDSLHNLPTTSSISTSDHQTSFAALLGLALRPEEAEINLLPKDLVAENRFLLLKEDLLMSAVLVGVVLLLVFGFLAKHQHDQTLALSRLESEIKKNESQVNQVKKMSEQVLTIQNQINEKPLAIDLFAEVHKITPSPIGLSLWDYESGQSLTLRGLASELGQVFEYTKILEKSTYLENVKVRYASKRSLEGKEMVDFELSGEIKGATP